MSRNIRINAPNLYYHIYARGNNRKRVFFNDQDYNRFLDNLERFRSPLQYKLLTYVLMPNHYHLLLKSGEVPLSKVMQILITAYSMYINKKYNRVGHLFQGRFQCIVIDKDEYLLQVHRYIHLNPFKSGLTDNVLNYPWSGYHRYFSKSPGIPYLDTDEVLSLLSKNKSKQLNLLHDFTNSGLNDAFNPLKSHVRGVLGGTKFHQKLTKVLGGIRP